MNDQLLEEVQKRATLLATTLLPVFVEYIVVGDKVKQLELDRINGFGKNHVQLKELWKQQVDIEEKILDEVQKSIK